MRFLRQVFQKLDWTSRIDRHRQMRQNHAAFVGGKNYSPSKVWIVTPSESLTKLSRIKMLNVDWRSLRNKGAFTSVTRDISDCAAKMCKEMVGYAESFVERTASMSIARKRVCQKHLCVSHISWQRQFGDLSIRVCQAADNCDVLNQQLSGASSIQQLAISTDEADWFFCCRYRAAVSRSLSCWYLATGYGAWSLFAYEAVLAVSIDQPMSGYPLMESSTEMLHHGC